MNVKKITLLVITTISLLLAGCSKEDTTLTCKSLLDDMNKSLLTSQKDYMTAQNEWNKLQCEQILKSDLKKKSELDIDVNDGEDFTQLYKKE
ncbi:hypothetical protein LQM11_004374 [Vibrio parahaemolyticus]|nr:hypothetical protein [Vibrio parahaemolyticus]